MEITNPKNLASSGIQELLLSHTFGEFYERVVALNIHFEMVGGCFDVFFRRGKVAHPTFIGHEIITWAQIAVGESGDKLFDFLRIYRNVIDRSRFDCCGTYG